ncbi:MAG: hypothetical protein P8016_02140 [Sedimentisphaerales bacterium]
MEHKNMRFICSSSVLVSNPLVQREFAVRTIFLKYHISCLFPDYGRMQRFEYVANKFLAEFGTGAD